MNKKVLWFLIVSGLLLAAGLVWVFVDTAEKSNSGAEKGAAIIWLIDNTPDVAKNCPHMKGKVDLGSTSWWGVKSNAENVLRRIEDGSMPPAGTIPNWSSLKNDYTAMVSKLIANS